MKTIEDVFNLIKQTTNLSGEINDYQVRLSNSRFERENLIGIYKIRKGNAIDNNYYKLAEQMNNLLIGLENYSGIPLKGVNVNSNNYTGIFYLSEDCEKVVGYLESKTDESGSPVN